MNKFIGAFLVLLLVVVAVIIFLGVRNGGFFRNGPEATVGDTTVHLTLADTPEERSIGLSGTNSLGENDGMLFLFDDKGYPAFWMKGMDYPIDIVFLDNETVVTIFPNVQPPKEDNEQLPLYQPTKPADRVLELPAGYMKAHGVSVGDMINLSL